MARSAFATACGLASLLAMSGTALAGTPCSGVVITDVIETAPGELRSVGERCYEREPGFPFYYDAPGKGPSIQMEQPVEPSVTHLDVSTIQALGAQDISDLSNPVPPGQGRADFRPE